MQERPTAAQLRPPKQEHLRRRAEPPRTPARARRSTDSITTMKTHHATTKHFAGPLTRALVVLCAVVATLLGSSGTSSAQIAGMPRELEHVGVKEHLDG